MPTGQTGDLYGCGEAAQREDGIVASWRRQHEGRSVRPSISRRGTGDADALRRESQEATALVMTPKGTRWKTQWATTWSYLLTDGDRGTEAFITPGLRKKSNSSHTYNRRQRKWNTITVPYQKRVNKKCYYMTDNLNLKWIINVSE